ncbi:MAG: hypothetical protein MRY21_07870 [Simkaniaceae bacterium]|nr:hypothetical protein [Simkaniaceae bacterium]
MAVSHCARCDTFQREIQHFQHLALLTNPAAPVDFSRVVTALKTFDADQNPWNTRSVTLSAFVQRIEEALKVDADLAAAPSLYESMLPEEQTLYSSFVTLFQREGLPAFEKKVYNYCLSLLFSLNQNHDIDVEVERRLDDCKPRPGISQEELKYLRAKEYARHYEMQVELMLCDPPDETLFPLQVGAGELPVELDAKYDSLMRVEGKSFRDWVAETYSTINDTDSWELLKKPEMSLDELNTHTVFKTLKETYDDQGGHMPDFLVVFKQACRLYRGGIPALRLHLLQELSSDSQSSAEKAKAALQDKYGALAYKGYIDRSEFRPGNFGFIESKELRYLMIEVYTIVSNLKLEAPFDHTHASLSELPERYSEAINEVSRLFEMRWKDYVALKLAPSLPV